MKQTSVEIEEELFEKYKKSGISLRNLIKMGLNSIEIQRNFREDTERMEKNIAILAKEMTRLRQENLTFRVFMQEKQQKEAKK